MVRISSQAERESDIRQKFGKGILLTGPAAACLHDGPWERRLVSRANNQTVEVVRCSKCQHHESWAI